MRAKQLVGLALGTAATALTTTPASADFYTVTNLVSDGFVPAQNPNDSDLQNPWGIVANANSPWWVADNGTGVSTLYDGAGTKQGLRVVVPDANGATGAPTGVVANTTADFNVGPQAPAAFIFATEGGNIAAWNRSVDATHAQLKVTNAPSGAVYKGLAQGSTAQGNFLYASNFHSGHVDVFDANFQQVNSATNFKFADPNPPPVPAGTAAGSGWAPFGIQAIGSKLYVTYALQDAEMHDDVHAPGNGFVDVFDMTGNNPPQRLITGGQLNSPWGIALAPAGFGKFGGDLLVGNFGNSRINAFDPNTGAFLGTLEGADGNPLLLSDARDVDGLWGISFGNGHTAGSPDTLYFASGVADEAHGLFGRIDVPEPGSASLLAGLTLALWRRRKSRGARAVIDG